VVVDSWSVYRDFWEARSEANYEVAYARARWLAGLLANLTEIESAPEDLRLAVELYGVGYAVYTDGMAIAWIGADPDDAEVWAELGPDGSVSMEFDGLPAAA
jgi:hypothetical protein